MALQSQAPRSGGPPRRYSGSSRRKKSLTPWLVLLGLVVIVAGLIVLFSEPSDPSHTANAEPADQPTDRPDPSTNVTPPNRDDPPTVTIGPQAVSYTHLTLPTIYSV